MFAFTQMEMENLLGFLMKIEILIQLGKLQMKSYMRMKIKLCTLHLLH